MPEKHTLVHVAKKPLPTLKSAFALGSLAGILALLQSPLTRADLDLSNDAHHCNGAHGHPHSNGGGFVADSASVAPTVRVDSGAAVCNQARVLGNAKVLDSAIVGDNALVSGAATVSGFAFVGGAAQVFESSSVIDFGSVTGNAKVYETGLVAMAAQVYGDAKVYGRAVVNGYAEVRGLANIFGNAVVGGIGGTDNGVQDVTNQLSDGRLLGGAPIVEGDAFIYDHANILGHAHIYESPRIYGSAVINHAAQVHGRAHIHDLRPQDQIIRSTTLITDYANVFGSVEIGSGATIWNYSTIFENAKIMNLSLTGCNAIVKGDSVLDNESVVTGNARVGGTVHMSHDTEETGDHFR